MDVNSLIDNPTSLTSTPTMSSITSALGPFIVISTIITLIICVAYAVNVIMTYRSRHAVLEIRDLLREMNERDKLRTVREAPATPLAPTPTTPITPTPLTFRSPQAENTASEEPSRVTAS